jgi:hypothetical protein
VDPSARAIARDCRPSITTARVALPRAGRAPECASTTTLGIAPKCRSGRTHNARPERRPARRSPAHRSAHLGRCPPPPSERVSTARAHAVEPRRWVSAPRSVRSVRGVARCENTESVRAADAVGASVLGGRVQARRPNSTVILCAARPPALTLPRVEGCPGRLPSRRFICVLPRGPVGRRPLACFGVPAGSSMNADAESSTRPRPEHERLSDRRHSAECVAGSVPAVRPCGRGWG